VRGLVCIRSCLGGAWYGYEAGKVYAYQARKVLKCTRTTRGGTPSYVGLKLLVYEALSYEYMRRVVCVAPAVVRCTTCVSGLELVVHAACGVRCTCCDAMSAGFCGFHILELALRIAWGFSCFVFNLPSLGCALPLFY
jgi:hypothetical protein